MSIEPTIRRATSEEAEACHEILWTSVTDFGARHGTPLDGTAADWWASGEPVHRFLAAHAAEWWVAVEPDDGKLVGYARSIERGGLFELTEFFVVPTAQSRGVGRALIERAFPVGRGDVRSIIATTDVRALTRYYGAGTAVRFPILTLVGAPETAGIADHLTPDRIDVGSEVDRHALREIDRWVLGKMSSVGSRRTGRATSTGGTGRRSVSRSSGNVAADRSPPSIRPISPTSCSTSRRAPAPWDSNDSTSRCRRQTRSPPVTC